MRARVRHHQRGEITRVRVRFSSEIGQIDIASLRRDRNALRPAMDCARRIGRRRSWNQTNLRAFATRGMIFPDCEKPAYRLATAFGFATKRSENR